MSRLLDLDGPLELTPLDPTAPAGTSPAAGSRALAAVAGAEVGVWEHSVGTSTDTEADEVFVVLSGSASIAFDDGTVLDVRPGSAVRLHAGDKTVWTVHETLRKLYVC